MSETAARATETVGAVQSVDRALTILELLAADGRLGVTEIAGLLGVHKSTASRLISTLESHGLVEQEPDRGRYRLGVGVLRLAGATRSRFDIVQESRPLTRALAADLGETVNIVILSGRETLYLDQVAGTSALQIHNWIGKRNPLHATANGRVLLAHLGEAEQNALLTTMADGRGSFPRLTDRTITTRKGLLAELAAVRERGHAVVCDELEIGLTAVAVPVRGVDGAVIASLSASGPTFRVEGRLQQMIDAVTATATAISKRLGWIGPQRSGS